MVTRAFLFVHRSLLLFYFNHDYRKNTLAHWLSITLANFVYIVDSSLIFFIIFYCNRIFKRNLLKLIKVIKTFLEDKLVCMWEFNKALFKFLLEFLRILKFKCDSFVFEACFANVSYRSSCTAWTFRSPNFLDLPWTFKNWAFLVLKRVTNGWKSSWNGLEHWTFVPLNGQKRQGKARWTNFTFTPQ